VGEKSPMKTGGMRARPNAREKARNRRNKRKRLRTPNGKKWPSKKTGPGTLKKSTSEGGGGKKGKNPNATKESRKAMFRSATLNWVCKGMSAGGKKREKGEPSKKGNHRNN